MKVITVTPLLLLIPCFIACTRQKKENTSHLVVQDVVVQKLEEVDPPPPPPSTGKIRETASRFKTLQQWLSYLCLREKPAKSISVYSFMLYESTDDDLVTVGDHF